MILTLSKLSKYIFLRIAIENGIRAFIYISKYVLQMRNTKLLKIFDEKDTLNKFDTFHQFQSFYFKLIKNELRTVSAIRR